MEEIREQQIQELEILQTIYPDEFFITPNLTDYSLNKGDNEYEQIDGPLLSDDESEYEEEEDEESDYEQEEIDWSLYSFENHPNPLIFQIKGLKVDFIPPDNSQYTIESIENNFIHKVTFTFKLPLNYLEDPEAVPFIQIKPYVEYEDDYIQSKYEEEDDENDVIFDDDGDVVDKEGIDIAFNCHIKNSTFFNMLIGENIKDLTDLDNYEVESWKTEMLENYMLGGTPMIFNIISYLKENFESGLTKQLSNFDQIHQEKLNQKLEIQNAKFKGTTVTKENFYEWRLKFRKELNLDERDNDRKKLLHAGRLTGKEIFDKGLANEDHEDL